jgi:hypothetical protein
MCGNTKLLALRGKKQKRKTEQARAPTSLLRGTSSTIEDSTSQRVQYLPIALPWGPSLEDIQDPNHSRRTGLRYIEKADLTVFGKCLWVEMKKIEETQVSILHVWWIELTVDFC